MPVYLNVVSAGSANPMARVEYALRADEYLTEAQVRQIMEYYIAVRTRRFGGRGPVSAEPIRSGGGLGRPPSGPVGAAAGGPVRYAPLRPMGRTGGRGDDL